jgi:hypothetical protein
MSGQAHSLLAMKNSTICLNNLSASGIFQVVCYPSYLEGNVRNASRDNVTSEYRTRMRHGLLGMFHVYILVVDKYGMVLIEGDN